jgi:hypothetical protein
MLNIISLKILAFKVIRIRIYSTLGFDTMNKNANVAAVSLEPAQNPRELELISLQQKR